MLPRETRILVGSVVEREARTSSTQPADVRKAAFADQFPGERVLETIEADHQQTLRCHSSDSFRRAADSTKEAIVEAVAADTRAGWAPARWDRGFSGTTKNGPGFPGPPRRCADCALAFELLLDHRLAVTALDHDLLAVAVVARVAKAFVPAAIVMEHDLLHLAMTP